MTEFRQFTDQMQFAGEAQAKLYKHGVVAFNDEAGKRWFQGVDRVEIHVSDGTEVGFKPTTVDNTGTYAFTRESTGDGGHVAFRSVLSHYGVWHEKLDESVALPVRYDNDHGMVVVDLADVVDKHGHMART
jgi:hypothetical protein